MPLETEVSRDPRGCVLPSPARKVPMVSIILLVGLVAPAEALTPPVGWTPTGPRSAVLEPGNPGRGELRELVVAGGTGDPDELTFALQAQGLAVLTAQPDGKGKVDLVMADRIGRATSRVDGNGATWVLVLANPAATTTLDPDALLLAALPQEPQQGWSTGAPAAVLPGGGDGNPWGATLTAGGSGWWGDTPAAGWEHDPAVVGRWEGTALIQAAPTRLSFRFENTGVVTLERKARGATTVDTGDWATRETFIRMELPGGGENLSNRALGSTLTVDYAGTSATLHRVPDEAPAAETKKK